MSPFQYVTASSPDEAVSLIGQNGRYLGGGTDLLGEMKDYIISPDVLVNVKAVVLPGSVHFVPASPTITAPDLQLNLNSPSNSQEPPEPIRIASFCTLSDLAADERVKKFLPGVSEAASEVGSPQIRNEGTLAGNLLQHSRCWYYRQPDIVCLKRGGDMCHAHNGENKYHSLFTGCPCVSPVVSNLSVILTALEATADIKRAGKTPTMTMSELYHEAWKNPAVHNSLDPQDFLVNVTVPLKRTHSAYRQVSEKSEFDWALVSCAAAGNVTNGTITNARVALGAVAPVPYMVEAAHHYLEGKLLTDETASKAADIILKEAKPLAHNGYKVPLAHALIRRTLLALNP